VAHRASPDQSVLREFPDPPDLRDLSAPLETRVLRDLKVPPVSLVPALRSWELSLIRRLFPLQLTKATPTLSPPPIHSGSTTDLSGTTLALSKVHKASRVPKA
jgi:hypothetical protein